MQIEICCSIIVAQSNNSDITVVKKISLFLIFSLLSLAALRAQNDFEKIEGISLESPHFVLNSEDYNDLAQTNANWLAVIPYGFSPSERPQVFFNSDKQWWGERIDGCSKMIEMAHAQGYKVMLKPQVWIFRGWVGEYGCESEEEWINWESSYKKFILTFARLADSLDVELFCLGTEYKRATKERGEYWEKLIHQVRSVYKGQLTYAANWDEFQDITFWTELDYIGIDAYFPLSEKSTPEISELLYAWIPIKSELRNLADSLQMKVLLTEFGYKSVDGASGKQWALRSQPLNLEVQRRSYLALFESLWSESWLSGGFVWKWQFRSRAGGIDDRGYTPQGKPALEVLKQIYQN